MASQSQAMLAGRSVALWPWHCLIMLAGTAALLSLAIWRMRKANLFRIVARAQGRKARGGTRADEGADALVRRWPWRRKRRPLTGSPIVWKELRRPFFPKGRRALWSQLLLFIAIAIIAASVLVAVIAGQAPLASVAIGLAYLLLFLFTISTASTSASAITREKEARTWPILLATPLDNGQIVRGKAVGSVRRNLPLVAPVPFLGILALLLAASDLSGSGNEGIPGEAILYLISWALRAGAGIVFLIGVALCMGTCVKTTTAAVAATFGIYIGVRMIMSTGSTLLLVTGVAPFAMMIIGQLFQAFIFVLVGLAAMAGAMRRLRRNVFA
jgi:ABC-type transport system involved in multi-copper enzyme maturation permease subunit